MIVRYYMNKFILASTSWIKFHHNEVLKINFNLQHYDISVEYTLSVHNLAKFENFHSISE